MKEQEISFRLILTDAWDFTTRACVAYDTALASLDREFCRLTPCVSVSVDTVHGVYQEPEGKKLYL